MLHLAQGQASLRRTLRERQIKTTPTTLCLFGFDAGAGYAVKLIDLVQHKLCNGTVICATLLGHYTKSFCK